MSQKKDVLTTGEVAKICNVAPRTVSKWFDSGQIQGYRIPGSRDRRIPVNALVRFMKQHHIPLDGLQTGQTRLLIIDGDTELVELLQQNLTEQTEYQIETVGTGFAAGIACEKLRPHAILIDAHLEDVPVEKIKDQLRDHPDLQTVKLIATSPRLTDGQANQLLSRGFDGYLKKPFTTQQAVEAIEDAIAIIH